jgi:hypothetical protein
MPGTTLPSISAKYLIRLQATYTVTGNDILALQNLVIQGQFVHTWLSASDAVYPMLGSTASSQAIEMLTDAGTFNLTYSGGFTINSNGFQGNGTTGFANTNFNLRTNGVNYTANSAGIFCYCKTIATTTTTQEMGAIDGSGNITQILASNTGGQFFIRVNVSAGILSWGINTTPGGFGATRTSTTTIVVWKNGSFLSGLVTVSAKPNQPLYIGAVNNAGSATAFSVALFNFAWIGSGGASQPNIYTDVLQFETTLGRN